jgi:hypothetical protein
MRYSWLLVVLLVGPIQACRGQPEPDSPQAQAQAGSCYRSVPLERGGVYDRTEMCEALERNLNAFCDQPPMICGLEIADPALGLSLPDWDELDIEENMELLEDLVRGKWLRFQLDNPGITDRAWSYVTEALADPVRRAGSTVRIANVDLMNRGVADTVYAVDTGTCPSSLESGVKGGPEIFLAQDARVMRDQVWKGRAEQGLVPYFGAAQLTPYARDIFRFEGRSYLFAWVFDPYVTELVAPSTLVSMDTDPELGGFALYQVCGFEYNGLNSIAGGEQ